MWYDLNLKRLLNGKNADYRCMTLIDDTRDVWKKSKLKLLEDFSDVYFWSEKEKLVEDLRT